MQRDEADHSVTVARGFEVNRARARNSQRMTDGFVAVGIRQHDVILGDDPVTDDLVGSAGAAQDVEGPVCAENACCVALRVAGGTDMVEPRAKRCRWRCPDQSAAGFPRRNGGTPADRVLEERHAAHVARCVPGVGAIDRCI